MERVILHSDMNAFYASVEMMLDPSLKGKAVAVCGSTESRHGIVLAKSQKAKEAGVKTAMANWEAKQACPELIMVPPHYDQYLKYSDLAHRIYGRYTDLIEPFGMDECWLDVSGSTQGGGERIAEEIRRSVREELGLTVSIGVSFNKIFAKLGSDMKKPDAVTVIGRDAYREKIWPLPASELLYVGRATTRTLARYGIHTIGDLARADVKILENRLGINGRKLWIYANGRDLSRVMHQDTVIPIQSIGHGITCSADLESEHEVFRVMLELSQDIGHRLRKHRMEAGGVQICVRGNDLMFRQFQTKLAQRTQLPNELTAAGMRLFHDRYPWDRPVRAVTIRAIDLTPALFGGQISLFEEDRKRERRIRMEDAVEDVRRRFGKTSLTYAVLMDQTKIPQDGRDLVRMPNIMYA